MGEKWGRGMKDESGREGSRYRVEKAGLPVRKVLGPRRESFLLAL